MSRPSKYHAIPTELDGLRFASQAEAKHYAELKLMERAGEIDSLLTQVSYPILVNGVMVCTYIADFVYRDLKQDKLIVADTKGVVTPVYRLKERLMKAVHGIDILRVNVKPRARLRVAKSAA